MPRPRARSGARSAATAQPRRRPAPLHRSQMLLLLLLLLVISWPPPGDAELPGPSDAHWAPDPDAHRVQELRRRYEELRARLRVERRGQDPALVPAPAVRILTPQVRLGSDGHVYLRLSRASLTEGLPEAYRVHRALLRLSPTEPKSWDVTRPLQRQLSLRGSRAPTLHLRLSPPSDRLLALSPSARSQLELHLRPRAARGPRSARAGAGDDCPLGPGRCCRLQTVRATLEDLGWTEWVQSPRELHLKMCAGECPSQYHAASTHAQIKARLHGLKPDAVPAPCCVPSGYEPMVLMHKTDGGVSLKTYDDIQATACHCA
ncbi:Growth/differentiation factor 15 [Sciurus carolinensis]|uniref:Growth/differentiation factor 15 n=1 Tax=Sciurus carolinensis TaxID=30640 RepID=A0AA41MI54_SCICA|nr:Growth/differentiation factor 15 [Sciurus carolinensis]